ncbi:MAG: hypothetical protein ACREV1_14155 [Gammaproteobacteria bacterium]
MLTSSLPPGPSKPEGPCSAGADLGGYDLALSFPGRRLSASHPKQHDEEQGPTDSSFHANPLVLKTRSMFSMVYLLSIVCLTMPAITLGL